MALEDRLRNPLADVIAARQNSQSAFYRAALTDPRFSSGFGMYPSDYKPKTGGSYAWILVKFGFVGGLGIFLNQYILFLLTNLYGLSLLLVNVVLSSEAAILANFSLNELLVFRSRTGTGVLRKALLFTLISSADLIVRLPIFLVLTNLFAGRWFWANLAAIFLTFGGRFLVSEKKIWVKGPVQTRTNGSAPAKVLHSQTPTRQSRFLTAKCRFVGRWTGCLETGACLFSIQALAKPSL